LIAVVFSVFSSAFVFSVKASPSSTYNYKFTVDREGFTNVAINFNSTDAQGDSWVFVPKFSSWNHTENMPLVSSSVVETNQVTGGSSQYFYQAFRFRYQAQTGQTFNMTISFGFSNGALIIEPRGVFYSPLIGFQSGSTGKADVSFFTSFRVNSDLAIFVGAMDNYQPTQVQSNHLVFSRLQENIGRIQVEFSIGTSTPQYTVLKSSDNKTFTFKSVTRYQTYAREVLKLYDQIYSNFTRLFNATLDNVAVQWFLPDFQTLLTVGGFVPFTGKELGEININIAFVRAVNGTVEVIAAHELAHRFIGKTGISPDNFLWFHEGMAQYISVTAVVNLNYEGAKQERDNLENAATALIQSLADDNFSVIQLQDWSPSYQPPSVPDVGALYAASYYVVSQLPKIVQRDGLDYYGSFFKLINGVKVNNLNVLALYLSTAANASVALSLQRWGFTVTDLYSSPVSEMIKDTGKTVEGVNPIFQPYKSFAEYLYQQALLSAERGDWERTKSLLQLAVTMANLAPLLTFVTIIALLALLVYILNRRSKRPKPVVPPLPPEILQPTG
jgi:hypothetical protein